MPSDQQAGPTPPQERPLSALRRAMWGRRLLMALPVAVVVAALVGLLGVHARTVGVSGSGYQLSIRYAATARPGLSVPFEVQVQHPGGFSEPVTLAVSAAYLEALQVGSVLPEPSKSTADGDVVELTFEPPNGEELQVSFQAEVDPSADMGRRAASVSLLDGSDPLITARFRTWVLP